PASGPTLVPTPVGDTGVQWRNAAYAVQWWIFAAFTLWMWARMVRDETRRARAAEESEEPEESVETEGAGAVDKLPVAAGDNGGRDDA
ncbi:MAG: hypothetical protein ACJ72B_04710, partial [Ornithinibacter sp.]